MVDEKDVDAVYAEFNAYPHASNEHAAMAEEIAELRQSIASVIDQRDAAVKDARGVVNVLGFFASCIKGGEPWSDECEKMLRAAFDHRATP